jgi:signal transduction histidine kinase
VSVAAACVGWLAAAVAATMWLFAQRTLDARMEAVARACHELRGPLAAVRLGVELGCSRGAVSGAQLSAIESELGRATVALSDLEGGGRPSPASNGAEFDLSALLRDSVGAWRATAHAAGKELDLQWRGGAPGFVGERVRIAQAVGNLIANAIEHGGARITVTGTCELGEARIEVADDGAGLPAPVAELSARARRGRGSRGRGLAIASGVAALHGGELVAAPSAAGARLVLRVRTRAQLCVRAG